MNIHGSSSLRRIGTSVFALLLHGARKPAIPQVSSTPWRIAEQKRGQITAAKPAAKTDDKPDDKLPPKKQTQTQRKKRLEAERLPKLGFWNIKALTTAEQYDLEKLAEGLSRQNLYIPNKICLSTSSYPDAIHAVAKYEVAEEPREIFFFEEGTLVTWNMGDLESANLLSFLKEYEEGSYSDYLVQEESESMNYTRSESGKRSHLKDGNIVLAMDAPLLDKFTFSNAISQSVKLGMWEASLNSYIASIQFVTEDLKEGRRIGMSREEVLRKQGELFALRHSINLSSDLLDTPDLYWERDELESLYQQTCSYFGIAKRIKIVNEKLNHCVELLGLLSSHLSDRHHVRLEWMIIILIMVEVAFEIVHYLDRYFTDETVAVVAH